MQVPLKLQTRDRRLLLLFLVFVPHTTVARRSAMPWRAELHWPRLPALCAIFVLQLRLTNAAAFRDWQSTISRDFPKSGAGGPSGACSPRIGRCARCAAPRWSDVPHAGFGEPC